MAWSAQVTSVFDGMYTKICTFTVLDNDAAGANAYTFAGAGMTDLPSAPIDYHVVKTSAGQDTLNAPMGISAVAATGFTALKTFTGGGANSNTFRVTLRCVHSIDQ